MALRILACVLVIGCGDSGLLHRVDAPASVAQPLQISGDSQFELWTTLDGGATAAIAYTRDGGAAWRHIDVPELRGDRRLQLVADNNNRAWLVGTTQEDLPGLVSVNLATGAAVIDNYSSVFPTGTTEVTLHAGGIDPDPMITARVPGATDLSLFLLRETPRTIGWELHPMSNVRALVGIYVADGGYFTTTRGAAPDAIAYCTLPDASAHCFDVPLADDLDEIWTSTPTPQNDWLWRDSSTGGTLVRRTGPSFDVRNIAGWSPGLDAIRFFALESGELGVLASNSGAPVWVVLDANTAVVRDVPLGDWSGSPGELDPARLVMLPDGVLAIPSRDGWYLLNPPGY